MTGYGKKFEFSLMSFKISDKELLKNSIKYGKKLKKTENKIWQQSCLWRFWEIRKKKTYVDSVITNFHNNKIPKEKTTCKCL